MAKEDYFGVVRFMKGALRMANLWTDFLETARLIVFMAGLSASNALAVIDLSCSGQATYNGEDVGPYEYRVQIVKTPDEQSKATMYVWGVFAGGGDDPLKWITEGTGITERPVTYFSSDHPEYTHLRVKDNQILKLLIVDRYDLTFEYGATSYDLETSEPSYWSVDGKCAPFVEREFKI